jgi:DNA (cytosine-5)-methyltransferase 1
MLSYISMCSGIESASAAAHPLGWRPVAFSEIEPFPSAVLAHHYPDVPNLGDMTAVDWAAYDGKADVVVAGTPCQAFSVAGARRGLADERGNLSLVFTRAVDAIDPQIVLWENVPGVLSSKDNAFGCFLAGLAGEDEALVAPGGKWTNAGYVLGPKRAVAWRILDAQYFGVAQRRRRVFVIASPRGGLDPRAILFESEGVRRDTAPSRKAGKGVAAGFARSVALRGREGGATAELGGDTAGCLRASSGGGDKPHVLVNGRVRRLTPTECEKLQGFEPGYTNVLYRNKPAADGPRYKALGNSKAVPVVNWIFKRIARAHEQARMELLTCAE